MPEKDKEIELRGQGREMACEGIIRSHFGHRDCAAGSEALRRLRLLEKGTGAASSLWSRSRSLKIAAAAAAALFVIVLVYALSGPVEPQRPSGRDGETARQASEGERGRIRPPERERATGMQREAPELPPDPGEEETEIAKDSQPQPVRRHVEPEQPPVPSEDGPVVVATVGEVAGEFRVRRRGAEEWLTAGALFSIVGGDTLATDSDGKARLDFKSGDYAYMNNDAQVTVEKEADEILLKLEKGEVYVEKATADGSVAVDTGFGRVHSQRGRFGLKMSDGDKCLLHLLDGEIECRESGGGQMGKYQHPVQAWLHRGKPCEEGTRLESEDSVAWAAKMRPRRRPHGPSKLPRPGRPGPPWPSGEESPPRRPRGPWSGGMSRFFRKLAEDFEKLDVSGDGKLTVEEVKLPEEEIWQKLVEEYDTDGDGCLSLEEVRAIEEKMKEHRGPSGRKSRPDPGDPGDEK